MHEFVVFYQNSLQLVLLTFIGFFVIQLTCVLNIKNTNFTRLISKTLFYVHTTYFNQTINHSVIYDSIASSHDQVTSYHKNRISCYYQLYQCSVIHFNTCTIGTKPCQVGQTHQDILNLVLPALDVVHDHVLKDVLATFQLVHLVIRVCIQHWPAQELSEWLK